MYECCINTSLRSLKSSARLNASAGRLVLRSACSWHPAPAKLYYYSYYKKTNGQRSHSTVQTVLISTKRTPFPGYFWRDEITYLHPTEGMSIRFVKVHLESEAIWKPCCLDRLTQKSLFNCSPSTQDRHIIIDNDRSLSENRVERSLW